ncbi:MAG: ribonuclease III [Zetaproteobacteria bacterium]|nr:MAG: ribonuclease III [Zetaproteobacteria bacterium]
MPKPLEAKLLQALEDTIGYRFADRALLRRALTHRSAAVEHMERLEFLGDAVLGMAIASLLYARFPALDEGGLSRMRAHLVRREGLLTVADAWSLDRFLRVGEGERSGGRVRSRSIVANAVEALLGAVYLDGGWEAVQAVIARAWQPLLAQLDPNQVLDAKTRLQEWTQGKGWGLPEYRVEDRGANASPRFFALCLVRGEVRGRGVGERKKQAEFEAARQAWEALQR